MDLEREAVNIARELGEVVFIGALAVNRYVRFRESRDVDLATAGPLEEKKMVRLGYRKRESSRKSWYTPRGIQADFYTKDVGGIPVDWILKTAVPARVGKDEIKIITLEGLIIAKHRAGRSQDIADLRQLLSRGRKIRWDVMGEVGTDMEIGELKMIAKALGS